MPASKRKRESRGSGDMIVDSAVDDPSASPVHNPDRNPVDSPGHGSDPDDIDSSDVESVDGRAANRFGHYGIGSIQALVEKATEVRLQSKRDYKTKKDVSLSPGSQAYYMIWSNRWEAFRTSILKVPGNSPITGEQIERCISSYAKDIVNARGGQPLVMAWATEAVRMIVLWAVDNLKGFTKLSPSEVLSISKSLKWLFREKILTKETRYEKNTSGFGVSAVLVRRFLSSTVLNANVEGQQSTRMLQVCGIVVLLVATAARTGDLTLSGGYNHDEDPWQFLKYSDIKIQVGGSTAKGNPSADDYCLTAEITLRAQKHQKLQQTNGNKTVRFSFDPSTSTLFMNPIIWIILLGLKSSALTVGSGNDGGGGGAAAAANNNQTYQAVIKAALATPTREIEWTATDRPVFHQFTTRCIPIYEKPSTAHTTVNAVQRFMRETGVEDLRVTPYAFRRGAIQDAHNLEGAPVHNERHAQQQAGHTHRTTAAGLTKMYAGDQRIDYLRLIDDQQDRLRNPFNRLEQAVFATSAAPAIVHATATQAVPDPVDEASGLPEREDLIDEDNELWAIVTAGLVNQPREGAGASPVEQEDFLDDDDELWATAIGGLADRSREDVAAQPVEQDLVDDDEEFWSTAFGGLAEEPSQPMSGLADSHGHGELEPTAIDDAAEEPAHATHGTEPGPMGTPRFTNMDITEQLFSALSVGADDGIMIEQELPATGNESRLDKLCVASAFVDTMVNLADEPWQLGTRAAVSEPVDTKRFTDCGDGIHRCRRCFRVYRYKGLHHSEAICAATFTAELWETPTVDSNGNVTWTCKSCGAAVHTFSSVKYHAASHVSTGQVTSGYSQQGQGRETTLRCLRCRRTVDHRGTLQHTKYCLKNFDPTTWTISEADDLVTWTCLFCNKRLKSWPGVMQHRCAARGDITGAQGIDVAGEQAVDEGADDHMADVAGEQAVDEEADDHMADVAGEQAIDDGAGVRRRCPYCPGVYLRNQRKMLEKHIRNKHPGREVPVDIDSHLTRPFKCPRGCTGRHERFTSQARLNLHLRVYHKEGIA